MTSYDRTWHEGNARTHRYSEAAMQEVFALFGQPKTMLDVGCGTEGHLVGKARDQNVDARGIDIAVDRDSPDYLRRVDLARGFDDHAETVLCWEVAEHLESDAVAPLVHSLARATDKRLVFTAAIPGQGGDGHVNEQPLSFWRAQLESEGLRFEEDATERLRARWKKACGPCWWYPQNVQVFTPGTRETWGAWDHVVEQAARIPGWMSKAELAWLAERASRAERCLEIGSWKGRSTYALTAASAGHVWVIDSWLGCARLHDQVEREGSENIRRAFDESMTPFAGRVTVLQGDRLEFIEQLRTEAPFDLVFIDATHSIEAATADIQGFMPMVRSGGILAGHDFSLVGKAVVQCLSGRTIGHLGEIWWATA